PFTSGFLRRRPACDCWHESFLEDTRVELEAKNREEADEQIDVHERVKNDGGGLEILRHERDDVEDHEQAKRDESAERVRSPEKEENEQTEKRVIVVRQIA